MNNDGFQLDRKFIVFMFMFMFIIPPAFGLIFSNTITYVKEDVIPKASESRTLAEIKSVLKNDQNGYDYYKYSVESFHTEKKNWHVVLLKENNSNKKVKALIGDFTADPKEMIVLAGPDKELFYYNMSLMGVPYDVIDEINKSLRGEL
jgi:hypothetical protein